MIFTETPLPGAFLIEPEPINDERGFFMRVWCDEELKSHGLNANLAQCNVSYNHKKGTLRGMHYQEAPHQETKIIRCTLGSIYDVIIDLRPNSPSYLKWFGEILSQDNHRMMYCPEGFAHGYQTLVDNVEVFYLVTEYYHSELARGVRWNDPVFQIDWPGPVNVILDRDNNYPLL